VPAANKKLTISTLWAKICWLITQRCLGWLALAAVYGGQALCPSRDLAAQDQRAVRALSINLSDRGEILVILRDGDVLARISDLEQAGLDALAGQREVFGGES